MSVKGVEWWREEGGEEEGESKEAVNEEGRKRGENTEGWELGGKEGLYGRREMGSGDVGS